MTTSDNKKRSESIITCAGLNCPERRSVCCNAKPKPFSKPDGGGYFICSSCGIEYQGGKCIASVTEKIKSTQDSIDSNFAMIKQNLNSNSNLIYGLERQVKAMSVKDFLITGEYDQNDWAIISYDDLYDYLQEINK